MIINFNVFYFLIFISTVLVVISRSAGNEGVIKCIDRERDALLKFKAELVDDYGRLSTWGSEEQKRECCIWTGIRCHNRTNHVVSLDLQDTLYEPLTGKISPSLLQLSDITYLDLSNNDFNTTIPKFIGSFKKLQYLNLSHNNFMGSIPPHLGNLSLLKVLDLTVIYYHGLYAEDLDWLTGFHSLQHLDLSGVNLTKAATWLQSINKLTHLKKLYMSACYMQTPLLNSSFPVSNKSNSLMVIDLSYNNMKLSTFHWFLNFSSNYRRISFSANDLNGKVPAGSAKLPYLSFLDLSDTNLEKDFTYITAILRASTMLEYLDLSDNRLYGSVPSFSRFPFLNTLNLQRNQLNGSLTDLLRLASCSSLEILRLSGNRFTGTLPETIGYLSKLQELDLSSNELEGVISEAHLFNLSSLQSLDLSFNSNLTIRISSDWNPRFQLFFLDLANCTIGPSFPKWLQNQTQMYNLDISSSQIYDTVPGWFWENSHSLSYLVMSFNHIYGVIPYVSQSIVSLDLSSNDFNGSLPYKLNGSLIDQGAPFSESYDLSRNKFSGEINEFFSYTYEKKILDLSYNRLSGELTEECFMKLKTSMYVNLGNNNLSGEIPNPSSPDCVLGSLHLRNNSFRGHFPVSIRDCSNLNLIDLGNNYFTGEIPTWIGESFSEMTILSLRSNEFSGILPSSLCFLAYIRILDISLNDISGTIPRCLDNFTSMSRNPNPSNSEYHPFTSIKDGWGYVYTDAAYIIWKGLESEFTNTLRMVKAIDLSSNHLVGDIPSEITSLDGLISLDLSQNHLVGSIPRNIDKLEFLNFLDLSENNLSGSIPATLSGMDHLGRMNLSFNNLSGKIPWSSHSETYDSDAYLGNPQLCGPPLSRACPGDQVPNIPKPTVHSDTEEEDDLDMYITKGFYVSMAIGFILTFWGTFGTLNFNKTCRIKFSKLLMALDDWWYVKIELNKRALQRYFQNQ